MNKLDNYALVSQVHYNPIYDSQYSPDVEKWWSMTANAQGQRHRHFRGWRLVVVTAGIILILIGMAVGILNKIEVIKGGYWFDIISLVLGALGLILALVAWLFPLSPADVDDSPATPNATPPIQTSGPTSFPLNINFSPNITMTQSQGTVSSPTVADAQATARSSHTAHAAVQTQDANLSPTTHGNMKTNTPLLSQHSHALPHHGMVFHFNAPLNDPDEFYGRESHRETLLSRTRNGASTAIVGPRRIGKTWLLHYLKLKAPTSELLGPTYRIGCLDATSAHSHTITGFVTKALEVLDFPLLAPPQEGMSLKTLAQAVEHLHKQNIRCVLCIDEFEGFAEHKEFDLDFLAGLRAMTQEGLVLITVTKKSLMDVVAEILGEEARTSPFFNVFQSIVLKPFNEKDATTFIRKKGTEAGFSEQEQNYLLERSKELSVLNNATIVKQWYPLKLQLVGQTLLEDKKEGPTSYHPQDSHYWQEFDQRVKEQYESVVKP